MFCYWLFVPNMIMSRSVVECVSSSFIFMTEYYSIVWIDHFLRKLFIHWLMNIWVLSSVVMKFAYQFLCGHVFIFLRYVHRRGKIWDFWWLCDKFFKELSNCCAQWLNHFTGPLVKYEGFWLFRILTKTRYCPSFWLSQSNGREVALAMCLICIFMCLLAILNPLLRDVYSNSWPNF